MFDCFGPEFGCVRDLGLYQTLGLGGQFGAAYILVSRAEAPQHSYFDLHHFAVYVGHGEQEKEEE